MEDSGGKTSIIIEAQLKAERVGKSRIADLRLVYPGSDLYVTSMYTGRYRNFQSLLTAQAFQPTFIIFCMHNLKLNVSTQKSASRSCLQYKMKIVMLCI